MVVSPHHRHLWDSCLSSAVQSTTAHARCLPPAPSCPHFVVLSLPWRRERCPAHAPTSCCVTRPGTLLCHGAGLCRTCSWACCSWFVEAINKIRPVPCRSNDVHSRTVNTTQLLMKTVQCDIAHGALVVPVWMVVSCTRFTHPTPSTTMLDFLLENNTPRRTRNALLYCSSYSSVWCTEPVFDFLSS